MSLCTCTTAKILPFSDHISPFRKHPETKSYHLSDFGYCFIIQHGSSLSILDEFLYGTNLKITDFERNYIYHAQYLYTTTKQQEFLNLFEIIKENVRNSLWNLNTLIYIPPQFEN